jgi:2,3-bisphosphoglycerate-dependent phosphoglycerate mutase
MVEIHKQSHIMMLRHGETTTNVEHRFTGQLEAPLTENGKEQAIEAASSIKKTGVVPDTIYVSPMGRALETALIMCRELGVPPEDKIVLIPEMMERNSGAFSGLTQDQVKQRFGSQAYEHSVNDYEFRPPDVPSVVRPLPHGQASESLLDVEHRVKRFFEQRVSDDIRDGKNIVVVGHENSLRPLMRIVGQLPEDVAMGIHVPNAAPIDYTLSYNPESDSYKIRNIEVLQANVKLAPDVPRSSYVEAEKARRTAANDPSVSASRA